jgi:hypothetical protein
LYFPPDQAQGKPALMFAHLKNKTDGTPFVASRFCVSHAWSVIMYCSYSKEETEKIAFEWQSLLVSAAKGGEPSTYVVDPGIILWSIQARHIRSLFSSSPRSMSFLSSLFSLCTARRNTS